MVLKRIFGACTMLPLLLVGEMALAKAPYGMAGCGLGSLVFAPGSSQTLAATTNASSHSQGFGITSGTSNCLEPNQFAAVEAQKRFFADNIEQLSKDIARGEGPYVDTLAGTLGCTPEISPVLAQELRAHFAQIFSQPGAMATLDAVKEVARARADVGTQCSYLIDG